MAIFLASDHAGFEMKEAIKAYLSGKGCRLIDVGCHSNEACNYAVFGQALAEKILTNTDSIGIAICGTGIGMDMTINRYRGARAANCRVVEDAQSSRGHNDANVIVFGSRRIDLDRAISMLEVFLKTPFEGGRHIERIEKMDKMI